MDDGSYDDAEEPYTVPAAPAFALRPLNTAAEKVVGHPNNGHLRYRIDNNTIGLWVDLSDPDKIFTLGRGNTDIYLPDKTSSSKGSPRISDLHASFQVVPETGAVLLFDHSDNGTVEPLPRDQHYTVKFRSNAKSVLVARGVNSRIAFGKDQWYQFDIQWHSDGLYRFSKHDPYTMGPRNSRHKKYLLGGEVGAGSYGTVWWALDATNGKVVAVKKFHKLSGKNLEFATREMTNLFKINRDDSIKHEHILKILDCAGGGKGDDWGEIFMPLMQGNLKTLVEKMVVPDEHLSDIVLRQMLLALQCIAEHKIIHRDVKPENILWEYDETGNYRFCLGDFGLSNDPSLARTAAGTEPFMAPEVFHRQKQTTKVDIWSLFATIVWTRTPEFRRQCSQLHVPDLHAWLVQFSKLEQYAHIRGMASWEPKKRPSAKKQLAILDGQVDEYRSMGSYGGNSEDEVSEDLNARFTNTLSLQDTPGLMYGSGSSDAVTSPELAYYEPYASGILEDYYGTQAGLSKRYMPPSPNPADAPRQGAWVMPYEPPYGPPDGSEGSGTAVPDTWTATAPTVNADDELTDDEPSRRHKGKSRV